MKEIIDMTSRVIGKLTVIGRAARPANSTRETYWLCRCECGKEIIATGYRLRNKTRSCECIRTKHGHASGRFRSLEYSSWHSMIDRCTNPNATGYENYGGRGIVICERWRNSFENFLADMGPRPSGFSIERKETNGNYEPGNCIWTDIRTQLLNRRNTVMVQYRGVEMPLSRVIDISGTSLNYCQVWQRIKRNGFSLEDALTKPLRLEKTA